MNDIKMMIPYETWDVVTLKQEFGIVFWIAQNAFLYYDLPKLPKIGKSVFRRKCEQFSQRMFCWTNVVTLEHEFEIEFWIAPNAFKWSDLPKLPKIGKSMFAGSVNIFWTWYLVDQKCEQFSKLVPFWPLGLA